MSADLDDFFAKKDKHRKKKNKGISNEDFVQKYENKCKETIESKEQTSNQLLSNLEGFVEDGEWDDFEDENKDYSGLKIQVLTLDDDEQREKEEEEIRKESIDKPWGRKEDSENTESKNDDDKDTNENNDGDKEFEEEKESDSTTLPNENKDKNTAQDGVIDLSQISAALFKSRLNRSQQPSAVGSNKKANFRIDDEAEFPDLGATDEAIADAKTFQPVRSTSTRVTEPPPPLPGQSSKNDRTILTENKYNALRSNKGAW